MRILVVSAALAMTAGCALIQPPEAAAPAPPPGPVALAAMPAAPPPPPLPASASSPVLLPVAAPFPVAAAPPAPEPIAPGGLHDVPVVYLSSLTMPALRLMAPEPPRLTLSNFAFDTARVQVLVTPYPDCTPRHGTAPADFALPLNGTRIVEAPVGSDVCWRREVLPAPGQGAAPVALGWTPWNRAYLSSGHAIDARL